MPVVSGTSPGNLFADELAEHARVVEGVRESLAAPFAAMLEAWTTCLRDGGKILFFGNGGSASDAQHLATELTVRYATDRRALPAIALTTDGSALTAAGNDYGFDRIFSRQVEALGRPGDIALAISTSGVSPNVIRALETARNMGLVAAGLTGKGGGAMVGLADPLLVVPSDTTARIQELHITLGQMLCLGVERALGLGTERTPGAAE